MARKSAILQMFYGERGNVNLIKTDKEHKESSGKVSDYYKELSEKLKSTELSQLFQKFCDAYDGLSAAESTAFYVEGFKFGLLIGIEACDGKYEE